jgi:hypothetical protein
VNIIKDIELESPHPLTLPGEYAGNGIVFGGWSVLSIPLIFPFSYQIRPKSRFLSLLVNLYMIPTY